MVSHAINGFSIIMDYSQDVNKELQYEIVPKLFIHGNKNSYVNYKKLGYYK